MEPTSTKQWGHCFTTGVFQLFSSDMKAFKFQNGFRKLNEQNVDRDRLPK